MFDMDGTLVDSEHYTALSVQAFFAEKNMRNVDIDCSEFDGLSWENIAQAMVEQAPEIGIIPNIAERLHANFQRLLTETPPPPIKQARAAVIAAHTHMLVAIVSSSLRESINETIRNMNIQAFVSCYAGADDYKKAKPAADGYLHAAKVLNVNPQFCLVFEDSVTGMQAAKNAGMQVVAITQSAHDKTASAGLADMSIRDYSELPDAFFESISQKP